METQRILVTGGAGFIGTNRVNELEKRRYFGSSVGCYEYNNLFMILAFMIAFALLFYQHDVMRKNEKERTRRS